MGRRVAIVGSGQTYHTGSRLDVNGQEMINEAVVRALENTGMSMEEIDAVIIGNMDHFEGINYVDTWSIPAIGAGKPLIKLTTGGTTGTTLAIAGYYLVASGIFSRLLIIGWEKNSESDTSASINTAFHPIWERLSFAGAIGGLAAHANYYLQKYGITEKDAARVVVRDRENAVRNPHAHVRKAVTIRKVLDSPMLADPVKHLDMCPRTDGACAVIYADEYTAPKLTATPAWIKEVEVRHDTTYVGDIPFDEGLFSLKNASQALYEKSGISEPLKELDVAELYLPYSFSGVMWMEPLGFCKLSEAAQLLWDGKTDFEGELPINPSGGVLSSNPIGATGLIRVAECGLQIAGQAGERQVKRDVKLALATGFGGCFWSDVVLLSKEKP